MLKKILMSSVLVLCLGLLSLPAMADGIAIQNSSFETTNPLTATCSGPGTCAFNGGPIPGWTLTGSGGSFQPSSTYFNLPLPDGNILGYVNVGTISQTLGASLAANTVYTLSVFIGDRLDGLNGNYVVSLNAGSKSLCSSSGSSASIAKGTFSDVTCNFTSGSILPDGALNVVLKGTSGQIDFDNVSLATAPVPEASSLALTGSGLLFTLLLFAYFKRKQTPLAFDHSQSAVS